MTKSAHSKRLHPLPKSMEKSYKDSKITRSKTLQDELLPNDTPGSREGTVIITISAVFFKTLSLMKTSKKNCLNNYFAFQNIIIYIICI